MHTGWAFVKPGDLPLHSHTGGYLCTGQGRGVAQRSKMLVCSNAGMQ